MTFKGKTRLSAIGALCLLGVVAPVGAGPQTAPQATAVLEPAPSVGGNTDIDNTPFIIAQNNPPRDGRLNDIVQTGVDAQNQARASQQRIDKLVEETGDLAVKYRTVLKEIDGLKVYNQQLDRQIANQQREIKELAQSIQGVAEIERQIAPLMIRMVDTLESFIELDIPFRIEDRRAGIKRLRVLLDQSDITASEKFRNVLEAYQIETAYGRAFDAYEGVIEIGGMQQNVNFLQVGRVGLLFQTRDGDTSGVWNKQTKSWDLVSSSYRSAIAQGLRVARKQVAADQLLPLPLPTPELGK